MSIEKNVKKAAKATDWNPMKVLNRWGVRSSHAYTLGLISLLLTLLSCLFMGRDSRRSRFAGVLTPTLFAIGLGLKEEE